MIAIPKIALDNQAKRLPAGLAPSTDVIERVRQEAIFSQSR
ncbi:hypothetical protein [Calothrix sp. NIES-2100]